MAGGSADFTYTVGFQADMKAMTDSIKVFSGNLKNNPLQLSAVLPKDIDSGAAQKALDSMKLNAKAIDDVIIKTQTLQSISGETYTEITAMVVKWRDANDTLHTSFKFVENNIQGLDKTITKYDQIGKKAADWGNRAEKMGQKEKESIQETATKLLGLIANYKELASSGDLAGAKKLQPEIAKLNGELDRQVGLSKRAAEGVRSWSTRMGDAIKNTISYSLSLGLIRRAQQAFNEALRFTIDLNTEMTKIQVLQVEGAQTAEEIYALAESYNALAQELGATTKEIAQGSVEWLRQGKTIAETQELLKASTMMSKLGNLEAAQSTEYLTSVLNGYGMEASRATEIVDKLVAVDNVAATSTRELATALRYSSAVAAEAGVSFEQLVSYIAVISQATRQNAEMIGQAMKTILTRMQDIMQGGLDEDGLGINNVERALRRQNMTIMESKTEFRDLGEVLEELAGKWDTINEVEQSNIAKAIAGTRQRNMFLVLMKEMGTALELQEVQYNSSGLAVDRYGIHLDSIEAKQAQLKASMEDLYMDKNTQKFIKTSIDAVTVVINLITKLGGLKTVLSMLAVVLITSTKSMKMFSDESLRISLGSHQVARGIWVLIKAISQTGVQSHITSLAFKSLGASIKSAFLSNAVGWVLLLVGAFVTLATSIKTTTEKLEESRQKIEEISSKISSLRGNVSTVNELVKTYEKLSSKSELLASEQEELYEVQNRLSEMFPELNGHFDRYGNFILDAGQNMDGLIDKTYEEIAALEEQKRVHAEASAFDTGKSLVELYGEYDELRKRYDANPDNLKLKAKLIDAKIEYENAQAQALIDYKNFGEEAIYAFYSGIYAGMLPPESVLKILNPFTEIDEKNEANKKLPWYEDPAVISSLEEKTKAFLKENPQIAINIPVDVSEENLNTSIETVKSKIENLYNIKEKVGESGIIGLSTEELNLLDEYDIKLEEIENGDFDKLTEEIDRWIEGIRKISPAWADALQSFYDSGGKIEKAESALQATENAINSLESDIGTLSNAWKEYSSTQSLSESTVYGLIQAGYASALAIDQETGAISINEVALRNLIAAMYEKVAASIEEQIEDYRQSQTMLDQIPILLENAKAWRERAVAIRNVQVELSNLFGGIASAAGGGGGGYRVSPEEEAYNNEIESLQRQAEEARRRAEEKIKSIEKEIKAIEKEIETIDKLIDKFKEEKDAIEDAADAQIKVLEKQLDSFNKIIDAKKESLKLQKEEDDFNKTMAELNQELADIQGEILDNQFDDTQEGRARRLELEQKASNVEVKITEESEKRKYDLQMQTLDDVQTEYEEDIKGRIELIEEEKDTQINAIDEEIKKLEEKKNALQETIDKYQEMIEAIREGVELMVAAINRQIAALRELISLLKQAKNVGFGGGGGGGGGDPSRPKQANVNYTGSRPTTGGGGGNTSGGGGGNGISAFAFHKGGLVESHHEGEFAGNLRSNEVFSKLLKGEYISTENQMDNFLKNILPRITEGRAIVEKTAVGKSENISIGDIILQISGNVDKQVVPDIKEAIFRGLNEAISQKGKKANAFSYSV